MRAGQITLVLGSLVASFYLADEATWHLQIGGWSAAGWFAGVCACSALIGGTVSALGAWRGK